MSDELNDKRKIISSFLFLAVFVTLLILPACSFRSVKKSKNIIYSLESNLSLNVFSPKKVNTKEPKSVFLFIHGGSWDAGKKSTYNFLGKGMARKGIVAVIIDYRLYPRTNYEGMAMDAATAVKWVKQNIATYGGDTSKICVSGHSAGGQIAALIATDNRYFDSLKIKNPIKGTILIDGFGLDMYKFFKNYNYNKEVYQSVFTKDTMNWKNGSPIYRLHQGMPPFLMFLGEKTNSNIIIGNNDFLSEVKKYQPDATIRIVPRKRHLGMIFSFYNSQKKEYKQIIDFMEK